MGFLHYPNRLHLILALLGQLVFNFLNYLVQIRITDEGTVLEMALCACGPFCYVNLIENGVYILVEFFFCISDIYMFV